MVLMRTNAGDDGHAVMQILHPKTGRTMLAAEFDGNGFSIEYDGKERRCTARQAHEALLVPISKTSFDRIRDYLSHVQLHSETLTSPRDTLNSMVNGIRAMLQEPASNDRAHTMLRQLFDHWDALLDELDRYGESRFDYVPGMVRDIHDLAFAQPSLADALNNVIKDSQGTTSAPYYYASADDRDMRFRAMQKYERANAPMHSFSGETLRQNDSVSKRPRDSHAMVGGNCLSMMRHVCIDIGGIPLATIHPDLATIRQISDFDNILNDIAEGVVHAPDATIWAHHRELDCGSSVGVIKAAENETVLFANATHQIDSGDTDLMTRLQASNPLQDPGLSVCVSGKHRLQKAGQPSR